MLPYFPEPVIRFPVVPIHAFNLLMVSGAFLGG